ncbi:MAG TPA: hypothetical protein VG474_14030, partial [Solirubrobacteraceae bacterium]|nr:hypothetical protein [Solirubrobacteraceae bacterium]
MRETHRTAERASESLPAGRERMTAVDGLATALSQAVGRRALLQRVVSYRGRPEIKKRMQAIRAFEERQKLKPLTETELIYGMAGVCVSPLDYGTIDIEDEQHLLLLYHHLGKQAMALRLDDERTVTRKDASIAPEEMRIEEQEQEARDLRERDLADWREMVEHAPSGATCVRQAFLGAGASIAYHIATMSPNIDPQESVIIGPTQPWREDRGPGVLGHADHMVTPMLRFLGDTSPNSRWLDRAAFSDLVDAVLRESLIRRIRKPVTQVERKPEHGGLYCITVAGAEPIYAQKIVSGIGVGGHSRPPGLGKDMFATRADEIGYERRVMDMDLFTRVADRLVK